MIATLVLQQTLDNFHPLQLLLISISQFIQAIPLYLSFVLVQLKNERYKLFYASHDDFAMIDVFKTNYKSDGKLTIRRNLPMIRCHHLRSEIRQ